MQQLIWNEPITLLVSEARASYAHYGVSTVIVIGGLGDWLALSDNVISLYSYVARSITRSAQEVLSQSPSTVLQGQKYCSPPQRVFSLDLDGVKPPFAPRNKIIAIDSHTKHAADNP
ncbi:hypothetical protein DOTSEDRAFT_36287 [Dothistroma septosporum NZE10]|uniref:ATPase of the ABC class C-terminal domain-containing protein n=1 Tax=Dothistroma septosporum (strain NZE10 / CBS 128990) TaxID=675120 RepID=N1PII0_DOTSN|nr:hypothetical protein DOTSEDRAFT_36287 [Dothistroma septosporum NZE10]